MTNQTQQIETPASAELADILSAYTELTERMQASHAKLADEVARLRGELESKNRQLQRKSRLAALGEMAAGIAHEIRNPLGGIALYAGLLNKQLVDRPQSRTISEKIAVGVDRLNGIVNDVLAFAGEMQPQTRSVTLSTVVGSAADLVAGRFEKAGVTLDCRLEEDVTFQADPTLLMRAVSNLLFNACDAAGEGEVRLRAGAGEDGVVIEICDSGSGIDPEILDRIFNPFFTTKDVGTGLGLAIVHRIVESHGGRVHVSNAGAGDPLGGAKFNVVLPMTEGQL